MASCFLRRSYLYQIKRPYLLFSVFRGISQEEKLRKERGLSKNNKRIWDQNSNVEVYPLLSKQSYLMASSTSECVYLVLRKVHILQS